MKQAASVSILRAALVLLMVVAGTQTILSAQITPSNLKTIVGVWDVQVTVLNCSTGDPIASFRGLHKYELGGTAQVVPSTNPAALSPHVGVWTSVGKDKYQLNFKMFRFDPAGNYIGWTVVRNNIAISKDATLYAGSGQATVYDLNGNPVGASCPKFMGTRFQ
jgi:WD40 repeat protein